MAGGDDGRARRKAGRILQGCREAGSWPVRMLRAPAGPATQDATQVPLRHGIQAAVAGATLRARDFAAGFAATDFVAAFGAAALRAGFAAAFGAALTAGFFAVAFFFAAVAFALAAAALAFLAASLSFRSCFSAISAALAPADAFTRSALAASMAFFESARSFSSAFFAACTSRARTLAFFVGAATFLLTAGLADFLVATTICLSPVGCEARSITVRSHVARHEQHSESVKCGQSFDRHAIYG